MGAPLLGDLLSWLARYARATQVFFVVSGFVAAQTISSGSGVSAELGCFVLQARCRLGRHCDRSAPPFPYEFARGWVPDDVLVGSPHPWRKLPPLPAGHSRR